MRVVRAVQNTSPKHQTRSLFSTAAVISTDARIIADVIPHIHGYRLLEVSRHAH
jgi:hypothetical protein